ncbi:MAG: hypothetical protein E7299_04160 [Lachnospiraceae bacterium]|nr:hypothetical protein [Lachnospiraceae bacterium]
MEKEQIAKEINRYVNKKMRTIIMFIASVVMTILFAGLASFVKHDFFAYAVLVMYAIMLGMMFIAIKFDLNKRIVDVITKEDYIEILKYMSEMPDNISKWKYYEILLMIKRTLNEIVYYHTYEVDEVVREYLYYLQTFLNGDNKKQVISSDALNQPYLRAVSSTLLKQIEQGEIKRAELKSLTVEDKPNKKQSYRTIALFSSPINKFLIVLVLVKVIVTVNPSWYEVVVSASSIWRIPYNTATDVMAAVLAVIALKGEQ